MSYWVLQLLNSVAFGSLLFLLSTGFSIIFGLMRIPNLTHGGYFMLGAYVGVSALQFTGNFWLAVLLGAAAAGMLGGIVERFLLRRLAGRESASVLATIGVAFIIADMTLLIWGGDPLSLEAPASLAGSVRIAGFVFPLYRLSVIATAAVLMIVLWLAIERTRVGALLRASVDDAQMARGLGVRVSRLFTVVFSLGAALAGAGGVLAGPILSAYPGLDNDMLPLALVVVILGGAGSLLGAFVGSFVIGALYIFGQALVPELAYVILFIPMVLVLAVRPQGLFGRAIA